MASEPSERVIYVIPSYSGQFQQTLEVVASANGHVDGMVVVAPDPAQGQAFSVVQEGELIKNGAAVSHAVWADDLTRYRNAALDAARKMKADWVLVGDPDMCFSEKLLADLKGKVVPSLVKNGMDAAGIMCLEEFEEADWPLDERALDYMAKPQAMSPRETTWHVQLFRLYPDSAYEGTVTRAVVTRDVLKSKSGYKSGNLPYHYSYTHRKASLRLWRNAAFRFYLGGGGADVGGLNPMWTEFLSICAELNIGNWPLLEKYVTTFHPNTTHKLGEEIAFGAGWPLFNPLVAWCRKALASKANDVGADMRATAEWIVWHHRDLLEDPGIAEGLVNPPKRTPEDDAEDLVTRAYQEVLGRKPDKEGLEGYVKLIASGKLPREQLAAALKGSEEYRQKFGLLPTVEGIHVDLPITATMHVTDDWMTKTLMGSETWKRKWQPPLDVGRFLEAQLGPAFMGRFYDLKAKDQLDLNSFVDAVYATVAEKAKAE